MTIFVPVRWTVSTALALMVAAPALVPTAAAQPRLSPLYNYVTLDYPNSLVSYPLGINNKREIAGFFVDMNGIGHGYLYKNGKFTPIDNPAAPKVPGGGTFTGGINDRGDMAGTYFDKNGFQHGFLMARPLGCDEDDARASCAPVFHEIDVPGAVQNSTIEFEFGTGLGTAAMGLNNFQNVVGMYCAGVYSNAYMLSNGRYEPIFDPHGDHLTGDGSKIFSINDSGAAAGTYVTTVMAGSTPLQISHGFVYDRGSYIPVMIPNSEKGGFGTQANGINALGAVVGIFSDPAGLGHAFLWIAGQAFTVDFPKAPYSEAHSINLLGDFTGAYAVDPEGEITHGFLATLKH